MSNHLPDDTTTLLRLLVSNGGDGFMFCLCQKCIKVLITNKGRCGRVCGFCLTVFIKFLYSNLENPMQHIIEMQ